MDKKFYVRAKDSSGHPSKWELRAGSLTEAKAKFKSQHVNLTIDEIWEA